MKEVNGNNFNSRPLKGRQRKNNFSEIREIGRLLLKAAILIVLLLAIVIQIFAMFFMWEYINNQI